MKPIKPIKYLLAGAILVTIVAPAEAADPRGVAVMPQVIYAAPVVYATPAPVVVVEPVAVEPGVPRYIVDQGPYYSGSNLMEFPKPIFHEDLPVRAYPYVRTWEAAHASASEPVYRRQVASRSYRYPAPRVIRYRAPISRMN
jgi:hypothetical protein